MIHLESLDGESGLRVSFERRGDRFGHTISLREQQEWLTILESREGPDTEPWPPSPPLQQFSLEERVSGNVALLVGMAGTSHWSMSVETLPHCAVRFEVACRLRQEPAGLGSAYQLRMGTLRQAPGPGWTVLSHGRWALQLAGQVIGTEPPTCEHDQEQLCLRPPWAGRLPATIRWGYIISCWANRSE